MKKLRDIIRELSEDSPATNLKESMKYRWTATKPDGSIYKGTSTLEGPALEDALHSHRITNPSKLIDKWNDMAQRQSKSGIIWSYELI